MALTFGGATHVVNIGSGSTIDDLNTGTILSWSYPTGSADEINAIFAKLDSTYAAFKYYGYFGVCKNLFLEISRATQSLN